MLAALVKAIPLNTSYFKAIIVLIQEKLQHEGQGAEGYFEK